MNSITLTGGSSHRGQVPQYTATPYHSFNRGQTKFKGNYTEGGQNRQLTIPF